MTFAIRCLSIAAFLTLLVTPATVPAETKEWDKKEVTRILNRLLEETNKIKKGVVSLKDEADQTTPRGVVIHDLYRIHSLTLTLVGAINAEQTRDETRGLVHRLNSSVKNAQYDTPAFPEIAEQSKHIDKGLELLGELNAFYGVEPPAPSPVSSGKK